MGVFMSLLIFGCWIMLCFTNGFLLVKAASRASPAELP